jgi:glycosyltransferase involved in cell wall biosynthesis
VNQDTGIKVPAHSPVQVVNDIAAALSRLARNPDLCLQMGRAGRQRVLEHFQWDTKASAMVEFYEKAAGRK